MLDGKSQLTKQASSAKRRRWSKLQLGLIGLLTVLAGMSCIRPASFRSTKEPRMGRALQKVAVVYSTNYEINMAGLEKLHPFDIHKYAKIYLQLQTDGYLRPEDVFVESLDHHNARLAGDARRMRAEARALRRGSEADGTDSATRARNETRAKTLEGAARTLTRLSQVKKWSVVSAKLPPAAGLALKRAVRRKCGLTESFVAWPRDTRFCEGPHCRRCKVGADLVRTGFARQENIVELAAAGAGERHRRRLDESARNWRKLFDFASGRSRRS